MLVHPGHIGMFQGTVQFTIQRIRGIANMFFGGDGLHLVALTGPGRVWLQSMPLPMFAHAIAPYLAGQTAAEGVAGGVAGGGSARRPVPRLEKSGRTGNRAAAPRQRGRSSGASRSSGPFIAALFPSAT